MTFWVHVTEVYYQKYWLCRTDHVLGRHNKRSQRNSASAYSTGEFN